VAGAGALEQALYDDLGTLADDIVDDNSAVELYRALAGNVWRKRDARGQLELDALGAERLVNRLRERVGRAPLDLAASAGDGGLTKRMEYALSSLGWRCDLLDTSAGGPPPAQG
jgi:hypothetical protein